ncbi:hypothetical protein AB6888_02470 [Carnobacterium maltaromaticum]|uniref:hypothetical protein n=1 Tax=Carnobacterium maltaromaticum TaxID=2751 RepID=UPI0039BDA83E
MGKIKGIAIILVDKIEIGKDPFGNSIFEDDEISIENVLISPTSSDDIVNQMSLTGRKAVYTLAIPKGDTHDWENKEVKFFNQRWRAFGIPLEGIEELIPLDWNKKVMVERYE